LIATVILGDVTSKTEHVLVSSRAPRLHSSTFSGQVFIAEPMRSPERRARHSAMVSFDIPEEESPVGDVVDAYDLVERYEHRFWEARDCFSLYDPNGKGRISGGVVAEALARFGARPDGAGDDDWAAEVAIAMRECGCDANGTVNFNSFKRVYNHTKGLAEKDSRGAPRSPMRRN